MILLRHGQSEFNVVYGETRRDPGFRDSGLTDLGRRQAGEAAERLRAHNIRRLIASPYARALETAELIAGALGLPVAVEPLVRERRAFSCDVGTLRSELGRRWPGLDFAHLDEQWWSDGEESEADVARRGADFRARMQRVRDWAEIAVITHWGFVRALTGQRLGNGESLRFDPAAAAPDATAVDAAGAIPAATEVARPRDP